MRLNKLLIKRLSFKAQIAKANIQTQMQFSTTVNTRHVSFTFANVSLNLHITNYVSTIMEP